LLNDATSHVAKRLRQESPAHVAISSIVAHELYYGAFKSARSQHNPGLVDALQFPVLEFDREDARQAGAIRALLAGQGKPIGPYDALIAGQALARNLTLVTSNLREFERVPGLALEDWQKAAGS
jgi:tRNA(fMet)-specific endonuclease VapC